MFGLGTTEMLVILALGVLLFGRNLPGIGRSVGKTVTEFKRGMKGLEDDLETPNNNSASRSVEPEPVRPPQRVTSTAPKFEDTPTTNP